MNHQFAIVRIAGISFACAPLSSPAPEPLPAAFACGGAPRQLTFRSKSVAPKVRFFVFAGVGRTVWSVDLAEKATNDRVLCLGRRLALDSPQKKSIQN